MMSTTHNALGYAIPQDGELKMEDFWWINDEVLDLAWTDVRFIRRMVSSSSMLDDFISLTPRRSVEFPQRFKILDPSMNDWNISSFVIYNRWACREG